MSPEEAAAALRSVLQRALSVDAELATRLARAGTSARFVIDGAGHGVTLVLDGESPSVSDDRAGSEPAEAEAEAEVTLSPAAAQSLAAGHSQAPVEQGAAGDHAESMMGPAMYQASCR